MSTTFFYPLLVTIVSSVIGAFLGYFAVWWKDRRDSREKFVRDINVGIATAEMIFQTFYRIKHDNLGEYLKDYFENKLEFEKEPLKYGPRPFNIGDLPSSEFNTDFLNSMLLARADHSSHLLMLTIRLSQVISNYEALRIEKKEIIQHMQELIHKHNLKGVEHNYLFYGYEFPDDSKRIKKYMRYSQIMKSIQIVLDDCIWFSKTLAEELSKCGNDDDNLFLKNKTKVLNPKFNGVDGDILPNPEDYAGWINNLSNLQELQEKG